MSRPFTGFSEEDLMRIKSVESGSPSDQVTLSNVKRIDLGAKPKRVTNQYKLPALQKQDSDDNINSFFDKCKLSIKTPTSPPEDSTNNNDLSQNQNSNEIDSNADNNESNMNEIDLEQEASETSSIENNNNEIVSRSSSINSVIRKMSSDSPPDIVRCADNYTEDELAAHKAKLAELQLQQKIMEEQNKKRKEMLSKALADRTKQTEEEVLRLEKIKKELQVLDGQFSQDVSVLRKKIDQACLTYADAEKHYLKVEKEFLHAKIQLQKEKEKKELLTEHLCALITHNETRKAQKLETLMLELATDRKSYDGDNKPKTKDVFNEEDDNPVIVDGVDEKTEQKKGYNESEKE